MTEHGPLKNPPNGSSSMDIAIIMMLRNGIMVAVIVIDYQLSGIKLYYYYR